MTTLHHAANGMVGWPKEWATRYHNACNDPCDLLVGPCACGAWHAAKEWSTYRCINGTPVLSFYNAQITEF